MDVVPDPQLLVVGLVCGVQLGKCNWGLVGGIPRGDLPEHWLQPLAVAAPGRHKGHHQERVVSQSLGELLSALDAQDAAAWWGARAGGRAGREEQEGAADVARGQPAPVLHGP